MNKEKINLLLSVAFLASALFISSCKKDTTTTSASSISSQQAIQVQNSDAQDAVADKTEEDVDNKLEELQNNGYTTTTAKSAVVNLTDTVVITVDHPDSTTFPKKITLDYYTYKDSDANENITKNGEIIITVTLADAKHPRLVSRAFQFNNFSVTTDSTTVILNGTRSVNRSLDAMKINALATWARISVTDNITANMNFSITTTGKTDTLKYTRVVTKVRTAVSYYKNVRFRAAETLLYNLKHVHFVHAPSMDTVTYTGSVTGSNEKGEAYKKSIQDKLIILNYKGSPVITSGSINYTVGTDSYFITFMEDPAHKHFTLVTVKNNTTGKTKTFDRRIGVAFKKWW